MPRVPITVMGWRCARCGHEWIPRRDADPEPAACPKCRSRHWDQMPRQPAPMMTYENFSHAIRQTLASASGPLTWTEIRTLARLPEKFPNNQWVRKMETQIGLRRNKDSHGIIKWSLS